jgi:hypothetical protein
VAGSGCVVRYRDAREPSGTRNSPGSCDCPGDRQTVADIPLAARSAALFRLVLVIDGEASGGIRKSPGAGEAASG